LERLTTRARENLFSQKPSGKFYDYRKWVSYILLIILVANPFLKINGNQFMLFNVFERRFNIFGFLATRFLHLRTIYDCGSCLCDFVYGYFGRFCGWICPQTIFLEMVLEELNIG
jgi:polyferredoxin